MLTHKYCTHCSSPIRPSFDGYVKPYKDRYVTIGNRCPYDGETLIAISFRCVLGDTERKKQGVFKRWRTRYDHDGFRYSGINGLCPICDAEELMSLCDEFEGLRLPPDVYETALVTLENKEKEEKNNE